MNRLKWEQVLCKALRLGCSRDGVVGVDYGFIYKSGIRLEKQGVRFHVANKLPLNKLSPEQILPEIIDDYACDVLEARYSVHGNPRIQCDPLMLGISIGNTVHFSTGTLGLIVTDTLSGSLGLISNWHVLCGSPTSRAGENISQPGPHHSGSLPARSVALLERWVGLDTGCDAALALLIDNIRTNQILFDTQLTIKGIESPRPGMKVVKFGTTSALTHGIIDGIGGAYEVDYSNYGDQKRWIDGIRIIVDPENFEREISLAGDSGAVWMNPANGKAIALHFAGEDGLGPIAEYALAQPLPRIMALLDVQIP